MSRLQRCVVLSAGVVVVGAVVVGGVVVEAARHWNSTWWDELQQVAQ